MPTTTNISTTYAGESAAKYVSAALLTSNTIENGGLTVMPNVKYRSTMKKVSTTDLLFDSECDFTATSTVSLTERTVEPKQLQVNLQFCRDDFRSDWDAVSMGYSSYDNLPPSFEQFMIAHILGKVAEKNEQNIWGGDVNNSGEYDGLITRFTADAGTFPAGQNVTLTAGATTSANVIANLGECVDALPSSLYGNPNLKIYVGQGIFKAYVRALGGFASGIGAAGVSDQGTMWYNGQGALSFDGIPVFMANGLATDNIVITHTENLFFATGLMSDMNDLRLIDMAPTDGSNNYRFVLRCSADVNYANIEDIVWGHL